MKSIFKGKVIEMGEDVVWSFQDAYFNNGRMVFPLGKKPSITPYSKTIDTPTILKINNIDSLSSEDSFYDMDNDRVLKIEKAMKATGNHMVYFTDFIVETIVNEESKINAEKIMEQYREDQQIKAEKAKEKANENKKWWEKLFGF